MTVAPIALASASVLLGFYQAMPGEGIRGERTSQEVRVVDAREGCHDSVIRRYTWRRDGDYFRYSDRALSTQTVSDVRARILDIRETPGNLLASVGITAEQVALHRAEILSASLPGSLRPAGNEQIDVPSDCEYLLGYDYLAPHIRSELQGVNWISTTSMHFEVVLPGQPEMRVVSNSLVPWMLPWTVSIGDESWTVADVEVSRAIFRFADPAGPCAELLDGSEYWSEEFWSDRRFWRRFVGAHLDEALSAQEYTRLPGYRDFLERYRVDDATIGRVSVQPQSLFVEISARYPSHIDEIRWWNLLEDGKPTTDWATLLPILEATERVVARHEWLLDWKNAGPHRTIGVKVVGAICHAEPRMDFFVTPIWKDSEFAGSPEIELVLRRGRDWCGTVYLGPSEGGALIRTAKSAQGNHWFDALDFDYDPRASTPHYGRVGADGVLSIREGPREPIGK